jgi:hypothetical protein
MLPDPEKPGQCADIANILSCRLLSASGLGFEWLKLSSLSISFVAGDELRIASLKLRGASPGVEG